MKREQWDTLEVGDVITSHNSGSATIIKVVEKGDYKKAARYRLQKKNIDGKMVDFEAPYPHYWKLVKKGDKLVN